MPKNKDRKLLSSLLEASPGDFDSSPHTPTGSPLSKKPCQEEPKVSNAEILRAVNALTDRFSAMEQQIAQNSVAIVNLSKTADFVAEEMKSLSARVKTNENKVSQIEQVVRMVQGKCDQAEIYSRRWNLRLNNLRETEGENIRTKVLEILKILTPDEVDDIRFSVDTIHRIGRPGTGGNRPRPVIIQFALRTYREKVWKAARDHPALKERGIRLAEDLTFAERQQRKLLWPRVKAAREEGKRAYFRGADAFIDGEKLSVDEYQDEY
ncbi:hypothetical protein DPX16_5844 [Anabarilius grahami]|uniref:Uncharacterized protein n=1 Tax=Anabarilius grahami TaxID=495550 RepID=A0A3N0YV74_ANAGA|nr:hypothetical protein DPX16_5844 [Anabarilius grahami]